MKMQMFCIRGLKVRSEFELGFVAARPPGHQTSCGRSDLPFLEILFRHISAYFRRPFNLRRISC